MAGKGGGCGGSPAHTPGAPPKVTKNGPKCPVLPSGQRLGWFAFCGWSGDATIAALTCPSAPSEESRAESKVGGRCCDPSAACLPLPCRGLCAVMECPVVAASPCRAGTEREGMRGEGQQAGTTPRRVSCCKERQALLRAAVPVL